MSKNKKGTWKIPIIIIGVVAAVALLGVVSVQSFQNKAISLEESVYTAQSDIKVQEKRRVDLVYNLADCVKKYDQHESDTLKNLAESMSKGNNTENVSTAISAIGYSFPKLESDSNYKQLMNELATTENLMAQYVIRRRRCLECGYKWNTAEIYEDVWRDMVEREKNIHRTAYTRIKRTDKCGY